MLQERCWQFEVKPKYIIMISLKRMWTCAWRTILGKWLLKLHLKWLWNIKNCSISYEPNIIDQSIDPYTLHIFLVWTSPYNPFPLWIYALRHLFLSEGFPWVLLKNQALPSKARHLHPTMECSLRTHSYGSLLVIHPRAHTHTHAPHHTNAIFFLINQFIYLFLAVLGLCFCARAFSSWGKRGPLFIAVRGPLTIAASLVAEHRLQMSRLSSCGSRAPDTQAQ